MRRHKDNSKKNMAITLFIAFIMIASVVGYTMLSGQESGTRKYGKYSLALNGNIWMMKLNDVPLEFYYLPEQVADIKIDPIAVQMIKSTYQLDTTSSPDDKSKGEIALLQRQLELILNTQNIYLRRGFTSENEFNLPVIDCENASSRVPVIRMATGEETSVSAVGGCIIVNAKTSYDFQMVQDRLAYEIIGIKAE